MTGKVSIKTDNGKNIEIDLDNGVLSVDGVEDEIGVIDNLVREIMEAANKISDVVEKMSNDDVILYRPAYDPFSPREWGKAVMVCHHPRYRLGDEEWKWYTDDPVAEYFAEDQGLYNEYGELDLDAGRKYAEENVVHMLLYIYDHGGITMSASENGNPFACGWDSSFVGFIYITKDMLDEIGVPESDAKKLLQDEVREYSAYLEGDVYEVLDGGDIVTFYGYDSLLDFAKNSGKTLEEIDLDACLA